MSPSYNVHVLHYRDKHLLYHESSDPVIVTICRKVLYHKDYCRSICTSFILATGRPAADRTTRFKRPASSGFVQPSRHLSTLRVDVLRSV